jgi:phosphoglycolate phosphatase-like HAD superfamily hydrolase
MVPLDHIIFDIHGPLCSIHPVHGELFAEEFIEKAAELVSREKKMSYDIAKQIMVGGTNIYHTGSLTMEKLGLYDKYLKIFYDMPYADKEHPELTKLIKELAGEGAVILCATNNPRDYTIGQLKHLGLEKDLFEDIASASEFRPRPCGDQIRHFAEKYDKRRLVFLGDRLCSDVLIARVNGVKSIVAENPENTRSVLEGLLDQIRWYKRGILKEDFAVDLEALFADNFGENVAEKLLKHRFGENILVATPDKIIGYNKSIDVKTAEDVYSLGERVLNMYVTQISAGMKPSTTMFKHMGVINGCKNAFDPKTGFDMKKLCRGERAMLEEVFAALKNRQYDRYMSAVRGACNTELTGAAVSRATKLFLAKPNFFVIRRAVPEDIPGMMLINENINADNIGDLLESCHVAELNGEVIGCSFSVAGKVETSVDPRYRHIEIERALESAT